jgi:hypothetical protein
MGKQFTLFTGQWPDLTLEEVARLAAGWATTASRSLRQASTSTHGVGTTTTSPSGSTSWPVTA